MSLKNNTTASPPSPSSSCRLIDAGWLHATCTRRVPKTRKIQGPLGGRKVWQQLQSAVNTSGFSKVSSVLFADQKEILIQLTTHVSRSNRNMFGALHECSDCSSSSLPASLTEELAQNGTPLPDHGWCTLRMLRGVGGLHQIESQPCVFAVCLVSSL